MFLISGPVRYETRGPNGEWHLSRPSRDSLYAGGGPLILVEDIVSSSWLLVDYGRAIYQDAQTCDEEVA